jgi:histone-lysine N-methyltransferase SETMAR
MIICSFEKCAHCGRPDNRRIGENRIKRVCPYNISYCTQMKEKICLTGFYCDESWVLRYQSKSKHASVQWKHPSSSSNRKFKVKRSAGKVIFTVFRNSQTVSLAYFQKRGENVNSALYCEVLLKLQDATRNKPPGQLARGVLLRHYNARPHTASATRERIQELQRELLGHPPYSPDLVPSDFRLFCPLINHLGCKCFAYDKEVVKEMRKWLRQRSKTSVLRVSMHS